MEQNDTKTINLETIELKQYLHVILKRKELFFVCFIIPILFGIMFTLFQRSIYRAVTRIDVGSGFRMPLNEVYDDAQKTFYKTQLELMSGEGLRERVSTKLGEWKNKIPKRDIAPKTTVSLVRGTTGMIELAIDSPYREYTQAYSEIFMQEFLNLKREQKEKRSEFALLNLTQEIDKLNDKLVEANNKLQQYRKENDDLMIEEYGQFSSGHLVKIAKRLSELEMEKYLIEEQLKALQNSEDPSLWISVIDDMNKKTVMPAIQKDQQMYSNQNPLNSSSGDGKGNTQSSAQGSVQVQQLPFVFVLEKDDNKHWVELKNRYMSLKSELARVSNLYRPEHPGRVQLEKDLSMITKEMKSEINMLIEKFTAKFEAIKLEEAALEESKMKWNKSTLESVSKVSQLEAYKDEVKRLQLLYETLLKRMNEIEVNTDFGLETVSIIDGPRIMPEPVAPKRLRNVVFSIVFGFAFAFFIVFFMDYIDDSIKSVEDLKKYTGIITLGVVHSLDWHNEDLPSHKINIFTDHSALESYRSIRTNILLSRPEKSLKSLLITSAVPSEGKTTTSVNTSIILAQGGLKVLLIDGDMRRPTVHKLFNLKNKNGFSSVLLQKASWDKCIQKTDIEGLDLLSAGDIIPDPPKLFHDGCLIDLLNSLMSSYDKVIIDSSPVLTVTDSVILANVVDGIILVARGEVTSRVAIMKTKEALLDNSSKIIGAIINNLPYKRTHSYYYYGYRYDYKYKYGTDDKRSDKTRKNAEELIV